MSYGDDLHLARLLPEFRDFFALIGFIPKEINHYAPYAAIVDRHGWPRMLRAARQLQGQKAYAGDVARLCLQYEADEQEAKKMAQNVQDRPEPVTKAEREAKAREFREIMARKMGNQSTAGGRE